MVPRKAWVLYVHTRGVQRNGRGRDSQELQTYVTTVTERGHIREIADQRGYWLRTVKTPRHTRIIPRSLKNLA
jgi:hypothetical protein